MRRGEPGAALAVFARVPRLGCVKTRLLPRYTAEQALALYSAMLDDTLETARRIQGALARVTVYWDEEPAPPTDFRSRVQQGNDLGARMAHAIATELADGACQVDRVILIGCDSPDLPPEYVLEALALLDRHDLVFGPSDDGGYYLVGARRALQAPFEGIEWESATVLERTLERCSQAGIEPGLLRSWYDIDRPEDLERVRRSPRAARVRALLEMWSQT